MWTRDSGSQGSNRTCCQGYFAIETHTKKNQLLNKKLATALISHTITGSSKIRSIFSVQNVYKILCISAQETLPSELMFLCMENKMQTNKALNSRQIRIRMAVSKIFQRNSIRNRILHYVINIQYQQLHINLYRPKNSCWKSAN